MHADVHYWSAAALVSRASRISCARGDNEKPGYFVSDFVIFTRAKYTAGPQDYSCSMKRRQTRLSEVWSKTGPTSSKKLALALEAPAEIEKQDGTAAISSNEYDTVSSAVVSDLDTCTDEGDVREPNQGESCKAVCCASESECFQPVDKATLAPLEKNERNVLPSWYKSYPWLFVCTTQKKVFFLYCRYGENHGLLTFSKKGETAFTTTGFNNWKKATEKFTIHESCSTHRETKLKWNNVRKPSIRQQVDTQVAKVQAIRIKGLLKQLSAIRFLLRQGIAVRGHSEEEGNLFQLLTVWSNGDSNLKYWLREK